MKIVSYNINGIRAADKLNILDWVNECDADVYCFQEVRANESIARTILEGYNAQLSLFEKVVNKTEKYYKIYNCGEVAGYAGTMVLTKKKPTNVEFNMKDYWKDNEGRTTTIYFDKLVIVNAYIPNGNSRLDFKMQYLEALNKYLDLLKKDYTVICVGDYNIAHNEIDLTNPKECSKKSVFLPIEREAFQKFIDMGYIDTYRYLYPKKVEYSWRSYRSRMETETTNKKFWKYRIDYALMYNKDDYKIISVDMPDLVYSDHLPVILTIEK